MTKTTTPKAPEATSVETVTEVEDFSAATESAAEADVKTKTRKLDNGTVVEDRY